MHLTVLSDIFQKSFQKFYSFFIASSKYFCHNKDVRFFDSSVQVAAGFDARAYPVVVRDLRYTDKDFNLHIMTADAVRHKKREGFPFYRTIRSGWMPDSRRKFFSFPIYRKSGTESISFLV